MAGHLTSNTVEPKAGHRACPRSIRSFFALVFKRFMIVVDHVQVLWLVIHWEWWFKGSVRRAAGVARTEILLKGRCESEEESR